MRKRRKNPGMFTPRNIVIAAGVGIGVWLLIRELRKRGMLGLGDNGYGTKPVTKPKPAPVYKPKVVQTLQAVKRVIPKASTGPVAELYGALKRVESYEKARPQAEAAISDATRRLQTMLVAHSRQVSQAKTPEAKKLAQETMNADVIRMQEDIDAKKRAFEASDFQRNLNQSYAEALAAAKAAMTERSRMSMFSDYGEKADVAMQKMREALVESGDEEYATSEGSIELRAK